MSGDAPDEFDAISGAKCSAGGHDQAVHGERSVADEGRGLVAVAALTLVGWAWAVGPVWCWKPAWSGGVAAGERGECDDDADCREAALWVSDPF